MAKASNTCTLSKNEVRALIGLPPVQERTDKKILSESPDRERHPGKKSPFSRMKSSDKESRDQARSDKKSSDKESRDQVRSDKKSYHQFVPLPMPQQPTKTPTFPVFESLHGFYFPGREHPVDDMCGASVFGNFWHYPFVVGDALFTNAEAAFQALKFPYEACQEVFRDLSGTQAFRLKVALEKAGVPVDRTYSGLGTNWDGMLFVLTEKFKLGSEMADHLLATGDAYLLEHTPCPGRDKIWSDNSDGSGSNWLGLQLMCIRERLRFGLVGGPLIAMLSPGTRDGSLGDFRDPVFSTWWQAQVLIASTTVNAALNSR
jgi:predicted NAD-dependent protein-ADP-ribosyltransferase YbiA (DUF1768 family)